MIEKFHQSDYVNAVKQLHKYCQDVHSPFGILLTETTCIFYDHKHYLLHYKPEIVPKIPYPKFLEDIVTKRSFFEFAGHKSSLKYTLITIYLFIGLFLITSLIWKYFLRSLTKH